MQKNHKYKIYLHSPLNNDNFRRPLNWMIKVDELGYLYNSMQQQTYHVYSKANEEKDKPFVIAVAQAIVNEYTVMVKLLHTSIAKVAVICVLWPKCFAGYADIVKMIVFGNQLL